MLEGLAQNGDYDRALNSLAKYIQNDSERAFYVDNIFQKVLEAESPTVCMLYGLILSKHKPDDEETLVLTPLRVSENLIKYVTDRKGHDRRYAIAPDKIKDEVGWYPETCFEEGIKKTIAWFFEYEDWMKNVTSGDYQKYYAEMYKYKQIFLLNLYFLYDFC